jgi:hypothetical protein
MLSVAALSSAFADEPQPPAAQPVAAASPAPAPNAPAAAGETSAAGGATAAATAKPAPAAGTPAKTDKFDVTDAATKDALIKQMRGRGYKPVDRKGTLVFCRSEGEIGTHFTRTRCSTIEELKEAEQTGKDYVNYIQQVGSNSPFKP